VIGGGAVATRQRETGDRGVRGQKERDRVMVECESEKTDLGSGESNGEGTGSRWGERREREKRG
jgi:hypothetical protein